MRCSARVLIPRAGAVPPRGHDGARLPAHRRGVAVRRRLPDRRPAGGAPRLRPQGAESQTDAPRPRPCWRCASRGHRSATRCVPGAVPWTVRGADAWVRDASAWRVVLVCACRLPATGCRARRTTTSPCARSRACCWWRRSSGPPRPAATSTLVRLGFGLGLDPCDPPDLLSIWGMLRGRVRLRGCVCVRVRVRRRRGVAGPHRAAALQHEQAAGRRRAGATAALFVARRAPQLPSTAPASGLGADAGESLYLRCVANGGQAQIFMSVVDREFPHPGSADQFMGSLKEHIRTAAQAARVFVSCGALPAAPVLCPCCTAPAWRGGSMGTCRRRK